MLDSTRKPPPGKISGGDDANDPNQTGNHALFQAKSVQPTSKIALADQKGGGK